MRLLIIEDEDTLRNELAARLRKEGFAVDSAPDGKEGLYLGMEFDYDAAIVDLGLPLLPGMDVIRRLRDGGKEYPILILTARGRWQDKVEGLEAGADDYLAKPFHVEELLARIKALLRRSAGHAQPVLHHGPLIMNTSTQEVRVDDKAIDLTAFEYKVLEYLALNAGKVISKTELTDHLYEQDFDRDSNVIEVFIRRLRKKLDPHSDLNLIETLRGRGYRLASKTDRPA